MTQGLTYLPSLYFSKMSASSQTSTMCTSRSTVPNLEGQVDLAAEFNLIPVILEMAQSLQKANDPQDIAKKHLSEIEVQHCRELLDSTPGLELSVEEQTKQLEHLKQQYKEKCELFTKYKELPVFAEALGKQV